MTNISNNDPQLYKIGFEAIEAQIKSLSNRKTDDPFIPELSKLQAELSLLEHNRKAEQLKTRKDDDPFIKSLRDKQSEIIRLESIQIDPATVKTARLDQAANPSEHRIKPKRKLIVVLGFVSGIILGVFVAFFSNLLEYQRKEKGKL